MLEDLIQEFHKLLKEADWMNEKTRQRAENKVDNMKILVGNPKFFFDDEKLDNWYQGVSLIVCC